MAKRKDTNGPAKLRWEYTPEQKRKALELYGEHGPAHASRETGIPRSTISRWATAAGARTDRAGKTRAATQAAAKQATALREKLKLDCRDRAEDLIRRMVEMHVEFVGKDGRRVEVDRATAAACKDYSVAAAVLIDKAELLDGRPTSRGEIRNADQLDREIERLTERLAEEKLSGDREPSGV